MIHLKLFEEYSDTERQEMIDYIYNVIQRRWDDESTKKFTKSYLNQNYTNDELYNFRDELARRYNTGR